MKKLIFWNIVFAIAIPSCIYSAFHGSRLNLWMLAIYAVMLWINSALAEIRTYLDSKLQGDR